RERQFCFKFDYSAVDDRLAGLYWLGRNKEQAVFLLQRPSLFRESQKMAFRFEKSGLLAKGALVGASVAVLLLSGCGKKNGDHPVGQVIAHVGQDEITQQELENEFRLANIPADKRDDAITKQALREIVTRKAVARQAIAAKIDREPTMQLDLLRDKETMLT